MRFFCSSSFAGYTLLVTLDPYFIPVYNSSAYITNYNIFSNYYHAPPRQRGWSLPSHLYIVFFISSTTGRCLYHSANSSNIFSLCCPGSLTPSNLLVCHHVLQALYSHNVSPEQIWLFHPDISLHHHFFLNWPSTHKIEIVKIKLTHISNHVRLSYLIM